MQEQIFNAKEKKVSRMSRDGLMEENLATKERRKLTDRESEVSFKKSDAEQSFVSGNDASGKKQKKQENRSPPKEEEGKSQEDGNTEHSNYHQGGRSSGYSHESAMAVRERKAKHRSRYHNQRQVKPGKLQFDKMETDGSLNKKNGNQQVNADAEPGTGSHRLQQAEEKAKKSAEKLQHAKKHQTRKKSIQMQRVKDEETQTVKHKLYFNESPKSGKNHAAVKKTGVRLSDAAGGLAHGKIHQEEPDNSAVEAAHKSELAGEIVLRQHSNRSYRKQRKEQRNLNRLERKVYKNTTSYQYKKYLEEHPEMQRKLLQKAFQKQRIKREYQKAYRAGKLAKESKDTAIKTEVYTTALMEKQMRITFAEGAGDKSVKVIRPNQLASKNELEMVLADRSESVKYYVYGVGELAGIYDKASYAIQKAQQISGVVISSDQKYVWEKGNRDLAYSIEDVALSKEGEETSLEACERYMKTYDAQKVDLTGCTLDQVLYVINRGCPVIALTSADHAILLTGYTKNDITYIDPENGESQTVSISEMEGMVSGSGNTFIGYIK